jgi:hypothetical protein
MFIIFGASNISCAVTLLLPGRPLFLKKKKDKLEQRLQRAFAAYE